MTKNVVFSREIESRTGDSEPVFWVCNVPRQGS